MTVTRQDTEVVFDDVKPGHLMAFTYWAVVKNVIRWEKKLRLTNVDNDEEFSVVGQSLVEDSKSADQFQKTQGVTKTQIVDILSHARGVPFTVTFKKKDGKLRELRGRLIGIDQKNLGYLDVEDLDKPVGDRFRLVDCRTIQSVIVGGVKYTVK